MKSIDLMYQTMLAELGQRSLDAAWTADFPPEGRFTPANIRGENIGTLTFQTGTVVRNAVVSVLLKIRISHSASLIISGTRTTYVLGGAW